MTEKPGTERGDTREPTPDTRRAWAADARASSWHQGSGSHSCGCASLCEEHTERARTATEELKERHLEAAKAWADAAEAEAAELERTRGEWVEYEDWEQTASGKATRRAEALSRPLGIEPDEYF